jgi:hypothetical protein
MLKGADYVDVDWTRDRSSRLVCIIFTIFCYQELTIINDI